MTDAVALAVLWIATMIGLGFSLQSRQHWKARHDIDHDLMVQLEALIRTTIPTKATEVVFETIKNDPSIKHKIVLEDDVTKDGAA